MVNIKSIFDNLRSKYWPLFKSGQTMLLVITGLAGYLSAYPVSIEIWQLLSLVGTLFLTIGGSTVINMWFDRDIDAKMSRTCHRPLVTGKADANRALGLGLVLVALGIAWSVILSPVYTMVALIGLFADIVVYTLWLKRRTPWSVVLGGISGGMPILGGRVIAMGNIDVIGLLLALAVLLWIPAHNLSYNMLRLDDYQQAAVPTFPSVYGLRMTRRIVMFSSVLVAVAALMASVWMALPPLAWYLLIALQIGLISLAAIAWLRPSTRVSANLFKYASVYMLGLMILLATKAL